MIKTILFTTMLLLNNGTLFYDLNIDKHSYNNENKIITSNKNNKVHNNDEIIKYESDILPTYPVDPRDDIGNFSQYNKHDFNYYYFRNFNENYIKNSIGNCGYTAISMLLSYYDSYWNDNFISEEYEKNTELSSYDDANLFYTSPGIIDNKIFENSYNEDEITPYLHSFIKEAIEEYDTSFFGLLLKIANVNNKLTDDKNIKSLGVNYGLMVNILEQYIKNNSFLNSKVVIKSNNFKESQVDRAVIRNEIIDLLKRGQPLIVGGNGYKADGDTFGHVCIAYYYDELNDVIFGNAGWKDKEVNGEIITYTYVNLDSYFDVGFSDYYYCDVRNLEHAHSNNYFSLKDQDYLCSCKLLSHQHNYIYTYYNEYQHYVYCICLTIKQLEHHLYTETEWVGGEEYAICGGCSYAKLTTYTPTPIM